MDYCALPIIIRNDPGAYRVRIVAVYNSTIVTDLKNSGSQIRVDIGQGCRLLKLRSSISP